MNLIFRYITLTSDLVYRAYCRFILPHYFKHRLGFCGKNVNFRNKNLIPTSALKHVYLHDNTSVSNFSIISAGGSFVMKRSSGASSGLLVVTGNHGRKIGVMHHELTRGSCVINIEKDVVVEEDVWIGARVTLLSGVTIGRGTTVAAGAVVSKSMPPYCICGGVPAKFIKFYWTIDEILEHESNLYSKHERYTRKQLEEIFESWKNDRMKN